MKNKLSEFIKNNYYGEIHIAYTLIKEGAIGSLLPITINPMNYATYLNTAFL